MKTQSKLINFPTQRNKPSKELKALVNTLQEPAIFVDAHLQKIILANEKAAEVSAYKLTKLQNLELKRLFPKLDEAFLSDSYEDHRRNFLTNLIKQSGIPIDVELKITKASPESQWMLIRFIPDIVGFQDIENDLLDQRWQALQILSKAPQNKDQPTATKQIMQAGLLLTGASFIAIYLPLDNDESLSIAYEWGKSGFLPKDLNASEINHLRLPYTWTSGSHAISDLHKKAIAGGLSYLASIPINQNSPQEGILVIGDQIAQPPKDLTPLLNILAGTISTCNKHQTDIIELNDDLTSLSNQLHISKIIKDIINDGLIFITNDNQILDLNTPAAMTLGYTIDEVKGKNIEEILIGEQSISHLLQSLPGDFVELKNLGDIILHRRDGHPLLINIKAIPVVIDAKAKIMALLLSDLSQHEEYRTRTKQLEQQALLGEVMAIFAHEVRNPINNISTGLQVMASNFPKAHPIQNEIDRIKQDLDRLAELMKSVLSFSKSKEYKIEPVNIEYLIKSLIDRWRPRMARNNILPRIQFASNIPQAKGDRRALEQVITNVIQNAINAMRDQGGVLGVRIEPATITGARNMINIDISDTGPCIPEELKQRTFEPFFTTNGAWSCDNETDCLSSQWAD
jgi:PAS domain S-box-containing protein